MTTYTVVIRGLEADDDGWTLTVPAPRGWADLQHGQCPDCCFAWLWGEEGRVPGARVCPGCGSLFLAEPHPDGTGTITRLRHY